MTSLNPNLIKKYFRNQKPPNLKELENKNQKYSDPYFLPNTNSLVGKDENGNWIDYKVSQNKIPDLEESFPGCSTGKGNLIFKRISEMEGTWDIFKDKIEMDDIKQGGLGDCYFHTAISALSNYPYLIKEKFRTIKYNPLGYYEVILFIDGEWQIVFLDDYFIVDKRYGYFAFAKPNNCELWAILLEKAWAKVNGGYTLIIGGQIHEAFQALTGFPSEYIPHGKISQTELYKKILESSKQKTLMGCSSNSGTNDQSVHGIVQGHAYAVTEAKSYGKVDLIKVRNPWGRKEWTGPWSDSSNLWTDELRKEFNCIERDDGVFWIDNQNYMSHFCQTTISYILYGSFLKSIVIDKENLFGAPLFFNIKLKDDGKLSINTLFRNQRFNRDLGEVIYPTHMVLAKYNEQRNIEELYSVGNSIGEVSLVKDLKKGLYALWVFVDYENVTNKKNMKMTVRMACSCQYQVEYKGKDENCDVLEYIVLNYNKNYNASYKQSQTYYSGRDDELSKSGIYNIIFINKTEDKTMYMKIGATGTGVNFIRQPGKEGNEFPPGQGFVVIGTTYGYQSSTSYSYDNFRCVPKKEDVVLDDSRIKEYFSLEVSDENTEQKGLVLYSYKYVEKDKLNDLMNFRGLNQMEEEHNRKVKEEEERVKKLSEKRKRREEEAKKKIEEEKKRIEEEKKKREIERQRQEEERKQKELAEKKRIEEERQRIEAQRKAEEEARKQKELEVKRQLEEAKKRQAEAIAKQEEEKKKQAEAELIAIQKDEERLKKAREEAKKRYQKQLERQQEEEERRRKYEEDMKRQEEEDKKREEFEEQRRREIEEQNRVLKLEEETIKMSRSQYERDVQRAKEEEEERKRKEAEKNKNKFNRKVLKSSQELLSRYFPEDFKYLIEHYPEKDFFKNDLRDWVLMIIPDGEYIGEVKKGTDVPHGRGMFFHEDNNYVHYVYSDNGTIECEHTIKLYGYPEWSSHSEISKGKKNGRCEIVYSYDPVTKEKKEYLTCNCVDDEIEGEGTMHFADGGQWTGNYKNGKKEGVGIYEKVKDGKKYISIRKYETDVFIKEFPVDASNAEEMSRIKDETGRIKMYAENCEKEKGKNASGVKQINYIPPENEESKKKREYYEKLDQLMLEYPLMMKIYLRLHQSKPASEEEQYSIAKIEQNGTLYIGHVNSNGNYQGKGVLKTGSTIYAGFWNNSTAVQFFLVYQDELIVYKGELKDWKYHGRGTLYTKGTMIYKGDFVEGKRQGYGILYETEPGKFIQGQFENDKLKDGPAKYYFKNGLVYKDIRIINGEISKEDYYNNPYQKTITKEGEEFINTHKSENPKFFEKLSVVPPREFSKDVVLKWKKITRENGDTFYGQFDNNDPYGIGGIMYKNNDTVAYYIGYIKHWLPHEKGVFYSKDFHVLYDGELEYGQKNGYGFEDINGELYYGSFAGDQRNGQGVVTAFMGKIQFEGTFVNGKKQGKGYILNKNNYTIIHVRCNQGNIEKEEEVVNYTNNWYSRRNEQKEVLPKEYQKYIDLYIEYENEEYNVGNVCLDVVFKKDQGKIYIGEVNSIGMKEGRGVLVDEVHETYYVGDFEFDKRKFGKIYRMIDDALIYKGEFTNGEPYYIGTYYFYRPCEMNVGGCFNEIGGGFGRETINEPNENSDFAKWEGPFYAWLKDGEGMAYDAKGKEIGPITYNLNKKVNK